MSFVAARKYVCEIFLNFKLLMPVNLSDDKWTSLFSSQEREWGIIKKSISCLIIGGVKKKKSLAFCCCVIFQELLFPSSPSPHPCQKYISCLVLDWTWKIFTQFSTPSLFCCRRFQLQQYYQISKTNIGDGDYVFRIWYGWGSVHLILITRWEKFTIFMQKVRIEM